MKIVVLGGGISTERDVSLSSSRMIYEALKKKGHQAVLLDVYLGYEDDYAGIFEKDVDWAENIGGIKESNPDIAQIKALRKDGGRSFFGPNVIEICQMADVVFLGLHGEDGERTERYRRPLTCLEFVIRERITSALRCPWIRAWQKSFLPSTAFRPLRGSM